MVPSLQMPSPPLPVAVTVPPMTVLSYKRAQSLARPTTAPAYWVLLVAVTVGFTSTTPCTSAMLVFVSEPWYVPPLM